MQTMDYRNLSHDHLSRFRTPSQLPADPRRHPSGGSMAGVAQGRTRGPWSRASGLCARVLCGTGLARARAQQVQEPPGEGKHAIPVSCLVLFQMPILIFVVVINE